MMPIGHEFAFNVARDVISDCAALAELMRGNAYQERYRARAAADEIADDEFGSGEWSYRDLNSIYQSGDSRITAHLEKSRWWDTQARAHSSIARGVMELVDGYGHPPF